MNTYQLPTSYMHTAYLLFLTKYKKNIIKKSGLYVRAKTCNPTNGSKYYSCCGQEFDFNDENTTICPNGSPKLLIEIGYICLYFISTDDNGSFPVIEYLGKLIYDFQFNHK